MLTASLLVIALVLVALRAEIKGSNRIPVLIEKSWFLILTNFQGPWLKYYHVYFLLRPTVSIATSQIRGNGGFNLKVPMPSGLPVLANLAILLFQTSTNTFQHRSPHGKQRYSGMPSVNFPLTPSPTTMIRPTSVGVGFQHLE